ncbi:hypothetical protein ACFSQ7_08840 [Paenibacillus rhizoplanae]
MQKKHCAFCDQIVPITADGEYDQYIDCSCSPGGSYSLLRDSYESILALSFQQKRDMLHLISGYIREKDGLWREGDPCVQRSGGYCGCPGYSGNG